MTLFTEKRTLIVESTVSSTSLRAGEESSMTDAMLFEVFQRVSMKPRRLSRVR